ncbi:MAG: patatin-like phospholipase family protein [Hyphomonadaceae bacterium]|jgi:predicted acylesterase/phospholipase RssA|nr:patatin-like phospholipase family protein [Hyphomonadaceae bacterium]
MGRVGAGWVPQLLGCALLAFGLAGCVTAPERFAVPVQLAGQAMIPDMGGEVRAWGDAPFSRALLTPELPRLKARYQALIKTKQPVVANLLALSGGGDDGAFGAGLLVGWGQKGDRPQFDLVTGISAGALIAPFAFLGREYDRQLGQLFTTYGGNQIYQANVLPGLLGGSALADTAPLKHLIQRYVDAKLLRRVAEERAKGRFLLIGTTNLDAQRPVYWDMGKIAQSRDLRAIELFRKVLLASAAIPGVFPPVRIEVMAGGKRYEEMHVDGGTTREVFFTPAEFSFLEIDKAIGHKVERRLWVVRNGKLAPEYRATEEQALAIAQRSLETLTRSQGIGDLQRMYVRARADGIAYNLAAIPDDFKVRRTAPFDRAYMKALYEVGLRLGRAGYPWAKMPPEMMAEGPR